LVCHDGAGWPQLLGEMARHLRQGRHAVALCAYELGIHLQGLPISATAEPLARVLVFEQCRRLTQAQVAAWLAERAARDVDVSPGTAGAPDALAAGVANVHADVGEREFRAALARIHDYIEAGDAYQVNYTYRLRFDAYGSPAALYARLRARQPVPYGALVALPDDSALLSLSPELFVRHADGVLTARPMKGTAAAAPGDQPGDNARRAQALAADPKNRAENLMIVDLLRNDMGRVAATGSVGVPALFDVRRYGDVLQMTSTVQARLRDGATLADIFAALYPCGSITGAPKRRSMEIIAELEASPRGIYTGAIGWFAPLEAGADAGVGEVCLSVPIRTLALQAPADGVRRGEMGVGAGIVFDSEAADEYAECQLKAAFLTGLTQPFELFETLYATAQGCRERARHLARLGASAHYFGFPWDAAQAGATLDAACAKLAPDTPFRLRLALDQSGALTVQSGVLHTRQEPVRLLVADDASRADALFLRHKTSVRTRYDAAWRAAEASAASHAKPK